MGMMIHRHFVEMEEAKKASSANDVKEKKEITESPKKRSKKGAEN